MRLCALFFHDGAVTLNHATGPPQLKLPAVTCHIMRCSRECSSTPITPIESMCRPRPSPDSAHVGARCEDSRRGGRGAHPDSRPTESLHSRSWAHGGETRGHLVTWCEIYPPPPPDLDRATTSSMHPFTHAFCGLCDSFGAIASIRRR